MLGRRSSEITDLEHEGAELDTLLEGGTTRPQHETDWPHPARLRLGGGGDESKQTLRKMLYAVGGLIGLVALAGIVGGMLGNSWVSKQIWPTASTTPSTVKRVFIRPVMNDEGLGSALQRMKGSIVLAEVVADATFLLGEAESEHHYSTSRILNAKYFNNVSLPLGKSCVLSHYLPVDQRVDLVHSVCAGEKPAQATELRQRLAPCHIIIDDVPDELYQDVSGCIRPFVRDRLDGIDQRRLGTARKLSVGVHIRWGDAAHEPGATRFRGSMDLDHINTIIHDARERFAPLDIRVIMENHDDSVLDKLTFGDYTLVDSGDSMADLKMLADNDLLLLGSSSYGVLSHLLAPKGLSIVEGGDEVGKYTDSGREAILIPEYSPSSLDRLNGIMGW